MAGSELTKVLDEALLTSAVICFGISILSILFTGVRNFFRDSTDGRLRGRREPWWCWLSVSLGIASLSLAAGLNYLKSAAIFFFVIAMFFFVMAMVQGKKVKFIFFGEYDILDKEKYPELYKANISVEDPKTCLSKTRISLTEFEMDLLKHRQQLADEGAQQQGSLDETDYIGSDALPFRAEGGRQVELGVHIEHEYSPDIEKVRDHLRLQVKLTLGSFFFAFLFYKSINGAYGGSLLFCYVAWVFLAGFGIMGAIMSFIGYGRYLMLLNAETR